MNKDRNKWWSYSDKARHVTQATEEARRKDRGTNVKFGAKEQALHLAFTVHDDDDDDDDDDDNYNSSKATYCRHN